MRRFLFGTGRGLRRCRTAVGSGVQPVVGEEPSQRCADTLVAVQRLQFGRPGAVLRGIGQ